MTTLFLRILHMNVAASVVILSVLLVRLLLKKAPKKWSYFLWTVVGFRLLCPVTVEGSFSLFRLFASPGPAAPVVPTAPVVPNMQHISVTPIQTAPSVQTNPDFTAPAPVTGLVNWLSVAAVLWMIGVLVLLVYALVSEVRLRRRLTTAIRVTENIWQSEAVHTPFLLGTVHPRIYIPCGLEGRALFYVLEHERCHIHRGDPLIRCLSFLLLAAHWINPLVWLSFVLMGRDMELSCDESVLKKGGADPADYSQTLLSFSVSHSAPIAAPLSFGESGVKTRIRNALGWKQPKIWVTLAAGALCAAVIAACGTDPKSSAPMERDKADRQAKIDFDNIMGWSGYSVEGTPSPTGSSRTYFAQMNGLEYPIGNSFGEQGGTDFVVDLDGDGITELVCNCVTGGDGHPFVHVYRRLNDRVEVGRIQWTPPTDWDNWGFNSTHEWFDPADQTFHVGYTRKDTDAEGDWSCSHDALVYDPYLPNLMAGFRDILQNHGSFLRHDSGEACHLERWTDRGDIQLIPGEFTVQDLDLDGIPEVIVGLYSDNYVQEYLILRWTGRGYYGYGMTLRGLLELKEDGTFHWSNGAFDNGCAHITGFGPEGLEAENVFYRLGEHCFIGEEQVSQEAYDAACKQQDEKKNTVFVPLSMAADQRFLWEPVLLCAGTNRDATSLNESAWKSDQKGRV